MNVVFTINLSGIRGLQRTAAVRGSAESREASRNGDVKEVYRQDAKDGKQGAETGMRAKGGGGGMRFYQKYSECAEGLLLVGRRQKMKDIRDWPSHSAASLPGYGFILLFRFYSVRL